MNRKSIRRIHVVIRFVADDKITDVLIGDPCL
jgi:hypothetical protein